MPDNSQIVRCSATIRLAHASDIVICSGLEHPVLDGPQTDEIALLMRGTACSMAKDSTQMRNEKTSSMSCTVSTRMRCPRRGDETR